MVCRSVSVALIFKIGKFASTPVLHAMRTRTRSNGMKFPSAGAAEDLVFERQRAVFQPSLLECATGSIASPEGDPRRRTAHRERANRRNWPRPPGMFDCLPRLFGLLLDGFLCTRLGLPTITSTLVVSGRRRNLENFQGETPHNAGEDRFVAGRFIVLGANVGSWPRAW